MTIKQMIISARTNHDIVNQIYHLPEYEKPIKDMLFNQSRLYLFEDCKEEIMLSILESKNPTLVDTYNKGKFFYYYLGICKKMIKSTESTLWYKYIAPSRCLTDIDFASQIENKSKDISDLIDNQDKFAALTQFIEESMNISRKHKIALELYKNFYLDDMTIKMISEKYTLEERNRLNKNKITQSGVFKMITFANQFIKENFDKSKYEN